MINNFCRRVFSIQTYKHITQNTSTIYIGVGLAVQSTTVNRVRICFALRLFSVRLSNKYYTYSIHKFVVTSYDYVTWLYLSSEVVAHYKKYSQVSDGVIRLSFTIRNSFVCIFPVRVFTAASLEMISQYKHWFSKPREASLVRSGYMHSDFEKK